MVSDIDGNRDNQDNKEFVLSGIPEFDAAKILYEAGENDDALRLAKKALKTNPEDVDLLLLAGNIYSDLKQPENAEKYIRKVLTIAPDNEQAIYLKITMKLLTGRIDDIFADLLRYLELIRWNAPILLSALPKFAKSEDEKQQVPQILKHAWIATLKPEIGFVYARYLRTQGEYTRAKELLEILENHIGSVDFYNECGIVFSEVDNIDRAINMYDKAIMFQEIDVEFLGNKTEPSSISKIQDLAAYISNRSRAYLKQGNFEAALKDADAALTYDLENGYHWLARANALEKLEKYAEFLQLMQKVLDKAKDPDFLSINELEELLAIYFRLRFQLSSIETPGVASSEVDL